MGTKLSFVIPCYRSENLVGKVIDEIEAVVGEKCEYEIIAVNDCSPDNVLAELEQLARQKPCLKVIDLARNVGKHAALLAGYSKARGDIIISVDDDGQCPVDHLWKLLQPLEEGYDVSVASYAEKKQSKFKNFGSWMNNMMAHALLDKPKGFQLSNFFAFKSFVCKEMLRYNRPFPYVDGLYLRATSKIKNVEMEERERISGSSGYVFSKSVALWVNGFTAFSVKPLRIATLLGSAISLLGFLLALFFVVQKIVNPNVLAGYSSLMAAILFIGGILMLLLGLIGEYIGRIYICINNSPQYVIRQTMNIPDEE